VIAWPEKSAAKLSIFYFVSIVLK